MADSQPVLLVYREVVEGDLRKFEANSADAKTGGGARDLRLPAKQFRPIMEQIFTRKAIGKGHREIRVATITYGDGVYDLEYWPATQSRSSEDRVARVHTSPALGGRPPLRDRGRIFVVFILWENGETRVYYAYEEDLRSGTRWRAEVVSAILSCMLAIDERNATRAVNKLAVQGYMDFRDGTTYCHG